MECSEMGNPFEQYTDTAEEEESPFAENGEINVTPNDNVEFTEDDESQGFRQSEGCEGFPSLAPLELVQNLCSDS